MREHGEYSVKQQSPTLRTVSNRKLYRGRPEYGVTSFNRLSSSSLIKFCIAEHKHFCKEKLARRSSGLRNGGHRRTAAHEE